MASPPTQATLIGVATQCRLQISILPIGRRAGDSDHFVGRALSVRGLPGESVAQVGDRSRAGPRRSLAARVGTRARCTRSPRSRNGTCFPM